MKRFRIDVPATSANLGPGFDTLGLALDIVDTVHVELTQNTDVVLCDVTGDFKVELDPRDNLLCRAYSLWGEDSECELPGARFTLESRIPVGKGFGSSAAAIVAGLAAAACATEAKDPRERILQLAVTIEDHADNLAAALLGGMTTGFVDDGRVHVLNVANHLALGIALFVPDAPLPTVQARAALPSSVPIRDAVFDLGRLAYLTTALIWGRWELIGPAMRDRLHQPYRARLIPALDDVIEAALEGGAYGAALSGGGPSVIALAPTSEVERCVAAMEACAAERNWPGKGMITAVREAGLQIKEEKDEEKP